MKKNQILATLLALTLLLAGCGGSASKATASAPASDRNISYGAGMDMAESEKAEAPMEMAPVQMQTSGSSVYQRADAKLIRRCTLELQSTEFDTAVQSLYTVVSELGGYFESSSQRGGSYYNSNAQRRGEYVIRIPADRYEEFRAGAGELGYVTYCTESTEDIGEKYYDTEARLKTLRTKQDRLLSLLEKAETMEDIITLESALSEVEYEIEQYSSTLNRYDGLVGYATFTVSVQEVVRVDDTAGQADTLWSRMSSGFSSGVNDLIDSAQDMLVWFSYNFFSLLFFVIVAVAAVTLFRRKKFRPFKRRKKGNDSTGNDQ